MSFAASELVISELVTGREEAALAALGSSPEVVETLLCEVEKPFPDDIAAGYLATAANVVRQVEGTDAAEDWVAGVQRRMRTHHEEIDGRVAAHYRRYPEALEQVPERFWNGAALPRNPNGYSPDYRPEEQGLGHLEDELIRTGLVPDMRRFVRMAYLFDIDGPLTDPTEKRVIYPQLLDRLAIQLIGGEPLALNTGRATAWALERVVTPLEAALKARIDTLGLEADEAEACLNETLERLCLVGEKGGSWVTFNRDGEPISGLSQQLKTPGGVEERIRELVGSKYPESMFIDPDKKTMTTVEMADGYDRDAFEGLQADLKGEIEAILEAEGHEGDFQVLTTPIATDVESVHVGKALGAQRICEWLRRSRLNPERYLAFGDDVSDMDMALYLKMIGRSVKFANIGRQTLFSHEFPVVRAFNDSQGSWVIMTNPYQ